MSITLRYAEMKDAKDLFRWKNDPVTRRFAIAKHEKISWAEHLDWLRYDLRSFQTYSYIIMSDTRKLGTIRTILNKPFYDKEVLEIAIRIDKRYRGLGIGTRALSWLYKNVEQESFLAKIVEGNIASMRCFINAGYKPTSYSNGVYIYEKTR